MSFGPPSEVERATAPRPSLRPPGGGGELTKSAVIAESLGSLGWYGKKLLEFLPSQLPEGEALRQALVAAAVAWLLGLLAPTLAAALWLVRSAPTSYYALPVGALVACAFSLLALSRGHYKAGKLVLLAPCVTAACALLWREGPSSPAASNLVLALVMTAVLTGWRGVVLLGVALMVAVTALVFAVHNGAYQARPTEFSRLSFPFVQIVFLSLLLILVDQTRLALLRAHERLEAKLREARGLEAVGRLASGVAHDFNNLLTIMFANTSTLAGKALPEDAQEDIAAIRAAAVRASELTKQLLALSRRQKLEASVFDLRSVLEETTRLLRRLMPTNVTVEREVGFWPLWVLADAGQVSQVLINLAMNARDAMPDGGTLRIRAGSTRGEVGAKGEPLTRLAVSDTGLGMDPATQSRIFEPFFTTKRSGTGLGLASVQGIVAQSGGQIRVRSLVGQGTEFEILLPTAEAPSTTPDQSRRGPEPSLGDMPHSTTIDRSRATG